MSKKRKVLVDEVLMLQKFPGKGGWTYAATPGVPKNKHTPFGWVRVTGRVDDQELGSVKLMPMGNGSLFLPIKAAIRKVLQKAAGDPVHVVLYADDTLEMSDEIKECFDQEAPHVFETYKRLPKWRQMDYLHAIRNARTADEKVSRIVDMIHDLEEGKIPKGKWGG